MPPPEHALNRLAVLKAVRLHGPLSRGELAAHTGLSAGSITAMTADLIKRGLIGEDIDRRSGRGRPRSRLQVRADAGIVMGASLADDGVLLICFVDFGGRELHRVQTPLPVVRSMPELADRLAAAMTSALESSPFRPGDIRRSGVALPAVIAHRTGEVHFFATLTPPVCPLGDILERRLGLPVLIENDTVWMARAEHWFGRARHLDDFTLVTVDRTIAAASCRDGLSAFGANGFNSEFGHMKTIVGPDAPPCFCGGRGCLAAVASVHAMMQALPAAYGNSGVHGMLARAAAGDHRATDILDHAGMHLGVGIANLVNMCDPGTVLLLAASDELATALTGRVTRAVQEHGLPGIHARTSLVFDVIDPEWQAKGIAALALEQVFLEDRRQR